MSCKNKIKCPHIPGSHTGPTILGNKNKFVPLQALEVYGGVKIQHHSFIASVADGVIYWLHTPATLSPRKLPVLIDLEAGWDAQLVCTLGRRDGTL